MKKIIDFFSSSKFRLFFSFFSYFSFLVFWFIFAYYSISAFNDTYNIDKFSGDIESFSGTFQDGFLYCQYSLWFFILFILLLYFTCRFIKFLIDFFNKERR